MALDSLYVCVRSQVNVKALPRGRTIKVFQPYILGTVDAADYTFRSHGHDASQGETAMNRQDDQEGLIDLGAVSEETKGGPWGVDDFRASLMLGNAGLTQD